MSRPIAFLTDFGPDSIYVGVMKSVLAHAAPGARVIDLAHDLFPQAVAQAGFLLSIVDPWLPSDAVVIAVVDPGVGGDRRAVIVECASRFYVGPDNGVFVEACEGRDASVFEIDPTALDTIRAAAPVGSTFHGRDVFAPAAAALSTGTDPGSLGATVPALATPLPPLGVRVSPGQVGAPGRFVDRYGNVMTGITPGDLRTAGIHDDEAVVHVGGMRCAGLFDHFAAAPAGTLSAIWNGWGRLELAVRDGSAISRLPVAAPESIGITVDAGPGQP